MKPYHLSEQEIQQYVIDKTSCGKDIARHIASCENCRFNAEAYQALFTKIREQPKAGFDFDLSALVLTQLPRAKSKKPIHENLLFYCFAFFGLAAIVIPAYLFRKSIAYIFAGVSSVFIYIMVIISVIMIVFQSLGMYKKYQRQMRALNFD